MSFWSILGTWCLVMVMVTSGMILGKWIIDLFGGKDDDI